MSATTERFITWLAQTVPAIQPMVRRHLAENFNEMLPYVILEEIAFDVMAGRVPRPVVGQLLRRLESVFGTDPELDNLIGVAFVETVPRPGQPGAEFAATLPPRLAAELARQRR